MSYVTREQFFANPPTRQFCDVPTPIGMFRLRSLTEREKCAYDAAAISKDGKLNREAAISSRARLIALQCVDADGNRIFGDDDVPRILEMPAAIVGQLHSACEALSDGGTPKNLETTINDSSP